MGCQNMYLYCMYLAAGIALYQQHMIWKVPHGWHTAR